MRARAIFYVAFGLALLTTLGMAGTAAAGTPQQTGQTCGGIGALKCPADLYCKYPVGQCNTADLAGTCVSAPKECPKTGPKVCGCDDKTYANECELLKAGAKEAKKGACTTKASKPATSQKGASAKSR